MCGRLFEDAPEPCEAVGGEVDFIFQNRATIESGVLTGDSVDGEMKSL